MTYYYLLTCHSGGPSWCGSRGSPACPSRTDHTAPPPRLIGVWAVRGPASRNYVACESCIARDTQLSIYLSFYQPATSITPLDATFLTAEPGRCRRRSPRCFEPALIVREVVGEYTA